MSENNYRIQYAVNAILRLLGSKDGRSGLSQIAIENSLARGGDVRRSDIRAALRILRESGRVGSVDGARGARIHFLNGPLGDTEEPIPAARRDDVGWPEFDAKLDHLAGLLGDMLEVPVTKNQIIIFLAAVAAS
ncbi:MULTISPECIES: hypothetical protein [unclassified Microbacterium]|uniref:hypothetical protein n=1 Tax=Microbacterium TaxID=33882 RepID=UPI003B9FEB22